MPLDASYQDGEDGGHIHPHKGQEEGLADGYSPKASENGLLQFGRGIEKCDECAETKGFPMGEERKEIDGRPDASREVEDKVEGPMVVCPYQAPGWIDRLWGKIPMEVVTTDGREKNKAGQTTGRGRIHQQPACLDNHEDCA